MNATINRSPAGRSWRLVYKGKILLGSFESTGVTLTINTLEIFPIEGDDHTEAEAKANARIAELGLVKPAPPARKIQPPLT